MTALLQDDNVAEETPVALVFNGISYAVMMTTPDDLEDFAFGFAFTEDIIGGVVDVRDIDVQWRERSAEVHMEISPQCLWRLKERRRALTGRTGCGICGIESLEAFVRPLPRLRTPSLAASSLLRAQRELLALQPLRQRTGATHAAAWCGPRGDIILVREDVGRHNALDKLIGALLRADGVQSPVAAESSVGAAAADPMRPARDGFAAISSRASYEMVDKAARAGIGAIAAVSAPTSLAIDRANESGVLLAAFVRETSLTAYAGIDSLVIDTKPEDART